MVRYKGRRAGWYVTKGEGLGVRCTVIGLGGTLQREKGWVVRYKGRRAGWYATKGEGRGRAS